MFFVKRKEVTAKNSIPFTRHVSSVVCDKFPKTIRFMEDFVRSLAQGASIAFPNGFLVRITANGQTVDVQSSCEEFDDLEHALSNHANAPYSKNRQNRFKFRVFIALGSANLIPHIPISKELIQEENDWLKSEGDFHISYDDDMDKALCGGLDKLLKSILKTLSAAAIPEVLHEREVVESLLRYRNEKGTWHTNRPSIESLSFLKAGVICTIIEQENIAREQSIPRARKALQQKVYKLVAELRRSPFDQIKLPEAMSDYLVNQSHPSAAAPIPHPAITAMAAATVPPPAVTAKVTAPATAARKGALVDIEHHHFDVALSFPGEVRRYVEDVANEVTALLGPDSCFYDNNYRAQIAQPNADVLLQGIYRSRSKLNVVFLCEKYQEKEWCGIEFRAIREMIKARLNKKIMFVKMDDGKVDGVFSHDGFIDGRTHSPEQVAAFIRERVALA